MTTNADDRSALALVLLLLGVLLLAPIVMGVGMMGFGMMGYGMPMMGWTFGGDVPWWTAAVALAVQLAVLAAVVGGGYLLFRSLAGGDDGGRDPAMDELRSAYARGDLTDEEFERRRERLRREE